MLQMSVAKLIHEIRLTHVSRDYPSCLATRGFEEGQFKQVFKYDGLPQSALPCCAVSRNSNLAKTSTPQQSIGSQRQPPKSFAVPLLLKTQYRRSGMALPIDPDGGGSALERMASPELFRHLFHRAPVHARMSVYVLDEPLEHQEYLRAARDVRMNSQWKYRPFVFAVYTKLPP
jgi:hypothetical protein